MPDDPELLRLRAEIDVVNQRLVQALHDRARLVRGIAALKRRLALPPLDPERERAMLAQLVRELPADGYDHAALTAILQAVFAASRALVQAR